MEQYISKSALVAEINRVLNSYDPNEITSGRYALVRLRDFLDTIQVKEVDCEREIGMYTTKELLRKRNKATNVFHLTQGDIDRIAEHFFELGLKVAQK